MIRKIKLLFIGLVLSIASGCTSKPVFTMDVYQTPTPFETPFQRPTGSSFSATPSTQSVPSASVSPVESPVTMPTFPPPTVAMLADFSPILYGKKYDANTFFLLLGGVQAGRWITPDLAAANIKGSAEYDVYPFSEGIFQILSDAPETYPIHPGEYFMDTDANYDQFGMVGVAHGWPVRQGKAEELPADNEIYKQVVLDWLKEAGVSDPQPGAMRIYRIDLEEDGTDEIFISSTHLDGSQHLTKAGDYSILLMRKVTGDGVVTLPVIADIYWSQEAEITYPRTYLPANFIDLNQDGVLEVVVDYNRWEADGALIYTIEGQEITPVP